MNNPQSSSEQSGMIAVTNPAKGTVLADRCRVASSHWARMVGLLNRRSLEEGEGLLIERCSSVHTIGMRFAIDLVFLDANQRVVKTLTNVKPWRPAIIARGAVSVLELPAGTIALTRTEAGDVLQISEAGA